MSEREHRRVPGSAAASAGGAALLAPGRRTLAMDAPAQDATAEAAPVQRKADPAASAGGAGGSGNLASPVRGRMESLFGVPFGDVRVHRDAEPASHGAVAFARGENVHFAPGQYQPETPGGQHLIAHELAHVVQQRNGSPAQQFAGRGGDAALEAEADRAADAVVSGQPAVVRGAAGAGAPQFSRLSDQIHAAADKGAIFTAMRAVCPVSGDAWSGSALTTDGDAALTAELTARLGAMPDDIWLASQIRHFGAEPLWPAAAIAERARRANAPGPNGGRAWAPEAGNISAQMAIPDAEAGEAGIGPIEVVFFPGRSERRAMVVGGVHGTEHQGVEVVQQLRAQLAADSAAGNPPFFSTVLVPTLISRSDTAHRRNVCGPNSSGVPTAANDVAGAACADGSTAVEPNRTFPGVANPGNDPGGWAGQSYQDARRDGVKHQANPNGATRTAPAQRMIAETRALIALIEHFQPERIASVHAHSVPGRRGDGPGVFVDPHSGVTSAADPTHSGAATAAGRDDDALATAMLDRERHDVAGDARADGSTNPFAARPLPPTRRARCAATRPAPAAIRSTTRRATRPERRSATGRRRAASPP
jgi:hypothetical protein